MEPPVEQIFDQHVTGNLSIRKCVYKANIVLVPLLIVRTGILLDFTKVERSQIIGEPAHCSEILVKS